MTDTLVLTTRPIESLEHGYDLRVANLCRRLDARQHLVVVPLDPRSDEGGRKTIDAATIFASVTDLSGTPVGSPSPFRHLRLSEEHYLQRAHSAFFSEVVLTVKELMARTRADRIVAFGTPLSGICSAIGSPRVLFDVIDSVSLTMDRQLAFARQHELGRRSPRSWLGLRRWRACEGRLPRAFARVTTVSDADSEEIRRCAGGSRPPTNVHTIPNGVSDGFGSARTAGHAALRRGVAFWGNLAFAPNCEAMRYFFREVYEPHLRQRDIEVCVIGRGAEPWLRRIAENDRRVRLLGFVDDLAGAIADYPVMVNPMVMGSGIKNKVLEAFGAGLAVVSTPLGIESIAGACDNTHYLAAANPRDFADAVLRLCDESGLRRRLTGESLRLVSQRYSWSAIAADWKELHDRIA